MTKRLKISFSPYTFARVSVMKSKLLKRIDYDRIMKMKIPEIVKFLEETEYKKEIDELAISLSGADLVEVALQKNLGRTLNKLLRISDENLETLILNYLLRKDIWNLKTILRGKFVGIEDEEIKKMLVPSGILSEKDLDLLLEQKTIPEVVRSITKIDAQIFKEGIEEFEKSRSLISIENAMDHHYYSNLLEFIETLENNVDLFKRFILVEIDMLNIKNLLKLKRAGYDVKFIRDHLFYSGLRIKKSDLDRLALAKSIDELLEILSSGHYKKLIAPLKESYKKGETSLLDIELAIDHYQLEAARFLPHAEPLSVNAILGYMFAKEIEVKNLHMIVKAKYLGLDERYITNHIVV